MPENPASTASAEDRPIASKAPSGRGWWLAGWLAVGTLLLGAGSVPWILSEPIRVGKLLNRLLPELDADITIGKSSIGWSGPIVFEDVHVLPRNGAAEPIAIARIEGSHGLAKILLSLGDLGTFRVQGLDLHVIFRANRSSNLSGLFVRPVPSAGGEVSSSSGRKLSPVRVRVEVEDAIARVDGPWSPEQWVSDPVDVVATLGPAKEGSWSEWTIEPVQLLSRAELQPSVAQGILAYIAPVLAEATRTAGLFSLRLDGGTFPVGDPAAGTLSGVLAMHAVDLGPGPMVREVIDTLPIGLRPPESIRVADDANVVFRLDQRKVWHDGLEFGVPLAEPGRRLDMKSSGTVGVEDGALDLKLVLPLPLDMPANRPVLQALAGKSISVGIGGVLGRPKVLFDGSIRAVAGQVLDELLGGRRGGGSQPMPLPRRGPGPFPAPEQLPAAPRRDGPAAGSVSGEEGPAVGTDVDPAVGQVIDLVGGVLEEVARRRAERAAMEQEAGEDGPQRPRRPLLDRIRSRRGVQPAP
jgi:hypothetical protein